MRRLSNEELVVAGVLVGGAALVLCGVIVLLQCLGLAGAWPTMFPVSTLWVVSLVWMVYTSYVMLFWDWYTLPYCVLPVGLFTFSLLLNVFTVAAQSAWVGDRYPGSYVRPIGDPIDTWDYYLYAIDVSVLSGFGFIVPVSLAARITFALKLVFFFISGVFLTLYIALPLHHVVTLLEEMRVRHRAREEKKNSKKGA